MQKDLVTSTSLFRDAGAPVAGTAAGVHDSDDKNVIRKNLKYDRVPEFSDQAASSTLGVPRKPERVRSNIHQRLMHETSKTTSAAFAFGVVGCVGLNQLFSSVMMEDRPHFIRLRRKAITFSPGTVFASPRACSSMRRLIS